ncbi:MAG: hypothetical protein LBR86_04620 [Tannerella sp.]|jgi:hypothetical protein|nr:hypothetical protein [Tannerella sp.]
MKSIEIIVSFFVGVSATIAGTYFFSLCNWLPFKKFKGTGVIKIFDNQAQATKSILNDIKQSKILYVLTMKGESFSNKEDSPLAKYLCDAEKQHRYLVSSLDNPYLKIRKDELDKENMEDAVLLSLHNFQEAQKKNQNIELKQHEEIVRFRIIFTTNYLYLSFQEVKIAGKKSPILKIRKDSSMYRNFFSLFNDLWEKYPSV